MVSSLNAHRLVVLHHVGLSGSIAGAARALGYSEATIAHHLRTLDAEARVRLTHRVGRVVRLTSAGEALARRGQRIAEELVAAETDATAHGHLDAGRLRIGSIPSYCAYGLPAPLALFAATYPGVDVDVAEGGPAAVVAMLDDDQCDLAVTFVDPDEPTTTDKHCVSTLFDDALAVVVSARHPLSSRATLSLADVAQDAWLTGCSRDQVSRLAAAAGVVPNVALATNNDTAIQEFVAHGLGVAVVPSLALRERRPDVHVAALKPRAFRRVVALTHPERGRPAAAFVELLQRYPPPHIAPAS